MKMTPREIVDERQRLDERAAIVAFIRKRAGIASTSVIADEIERGAPSEGNKKGDADILPDCMMPDGADPCLGYQQLWQRYLALKSRPQEQPRTATGEPVERMAAWLHSEVEWPELNFPNHSWPEHPDDTGQRGDGWLKIVPQDVQEQFRDIARRLLSVSPAAAQGWQMVPLIPTRQMRDAGWGAIGAERKRIAPLEQYGDTLAVLAYRAMLAAAPPSPAAQEQE